LGGAFVPPPYPYERLDTLAAVARAAPGGIVDCSIGTPCDPVPGVVIEAVRAAAAASAGYPPSAGTPALRDAAAAWIERTFGVAIDGSAIGACLGTKEFVGGLPHLLHRRDPERDTVLYPAVAYPTYQMGAALAGIRAVPVPVDGEWHLDVDAIDPEDARRALVLWVNEPGNPTSSVASHADLARVAAWGRRHGVIVASDECYVEFAPVAATVLASGLDGVLAVHSLSKRSNLAGMRCGFYAGDPTLVHYLVEARKHWGFMAPTPVQAAAVAALGDEAHVADQRSRYAERRKLVLDALGELNAPAAPAELGGLDLVHDGGPMSFYLWLRSRSGVGGWTIAERLATLGLLVSPGDLYGPAGADHVRLALVQPTDRLRLAVERLAELFAKECP
jgi:succinyldiaminopimelate transaminase